ncbi:hypothetical protein TrLO_g4444 [Triparma laevis f. longispina]|uniref:G-protein coupled receptors family 3 profile domain-containing protein n=1 Tax=Triparma laevis f. longispina TaxID=1714387 RepID=A0A9W7FSU9_9STRA|nr:hypothetical protein TrLO_g4444 [Triparma laevis f. longispina]
MGTEDCCAYVEQPMHATSSSSRIAFYNPGISEYDRFAEDSSLLQMTSDNNFIEIDIVGETLYFTNMARQAVEEFSVHTGDYVRDSCTAAMLGEGNEDFGPGAFRISPHTGEYFVADTESAETQIAGTKVYRYSGNDCSNAELFFWRNETDPTSTTVPPLIRGYIVEDMAFGSKHLMFMLATWGNDMHVLSFNVTTETLIASVNFGSTYPFTGIEAMEDDTVFLSARSSSGLSALTKINPLTGSQILTSGNTNPALKVYNGRPAFGTQGMGGRYDVTGGTAQGIPPSIDAWGVRKAPNGLLYVADYSFGVPWAIHPTSGRIIGRLGTSFGMLIFAHNIAFNNGPWGLRSDVSISSDNVMAGHPLTVTVDVMNSAGVEFCGEPHLTAVQSGYTWFGEAPSFNSDIGTFNAWTRDEDPAKCNRWTAAIPGEVASLVYSDVAAQEIVDPRLKAYCESESRSCTYDDYKFKITVFTGKVEFNKVVGSPLPFSVAPGSPKGSETQLLTTMTEVSSNETDCVEVEARDEYGNNLLYGGSVDQFVFKIDDENYVAPGSPSTPLDTVGLPKNKINVEDLENGHYRICSMYGPAGVHFLSMHLSGEEVKSSPLAVVVTPSAATGGETIASGDGIDRIDEMDGAENIFYVAPKDSRGNLLTSSLLDVSMLSVSITYNGAGRGDRNKGVGVDTKVELETDGRFKVCYIITGDLKRDSDYKEVSMSVTINGEAVQVQLENEDETKPLTGLGVMQGSRVIDYKMSTGLVVTLYLECSFLIGLTCWFIGLVKYWENENAIKFSQRKFLYIMLIGILFIYLSFLLLIVDYSDQVCGAENFFFHVGIWTTLLPLVAKTYRTNKIANNRGLKRVKITDKMLLQWTGGAMFLVVVLLILQIGFYPAKAMSMEGSPRVLENGVAVTYIVTQCTAGMSPVSALLFAGELGVICYLAVLAHFTRKVPSAFAEAKYIALSIYNLCLIIAFLAILVGVVQINTDYPELFMAITGFCMVMGVGAMQVMIFLPKFIIILRKKEVKLEDILGEDEKKRLPRPSKSLEMSGHGANPMTGAERRHSGVHRAGSASKFMTPMVASSLAHGSMASVMEVDIKVGGLSESPGFGGSSSSGTSPSSEEVGSLKTELFRLRKLEDQLKRDNDRQQKEIDKMRELNKKLATSSRASLGRSRSFVVQPPGDSDWLPMMDDDGKPYYYNSKTDDCTYNVPKKW